jgi:hypothetical protein
LLAILAVLAWWQHGSRPLAHAPGVLVADAPLQQPLDAPVAPLRKADASIKPLARFAISARVLARADYGWDPGSGLSPVDLALGWGRMSDMAVLDKIEISNRRASTSGTYASFQSPEREIIESSANMHLIPADG